MQSLKVIDENNFIGMNDRLPSHLLPRGVFQRVVNALVADNKITKRPGTDNVADSLGSFDILGGSPYEPTGVSKRQIVCLNGSSNAQLYYWTGTGTFTALGSANLTKDATMNFCQAGNYIFGFNRNEVVMVDSSLSVTLNPSSVPKGKAGFWFHNYLFVINTVGVSSRIYWSNLGDPTTFSASDYFDVNANDGDECMAIAALNDELFVFKKNTIWSITGWSGSTFTSTTAAGQNTNSKLYGYGCWSHQSVISTGRDLYYLSFLGGIPYIRSFRQTIFAETIEEGIVSNEIQTSLDGINKTLLESVAAVYDGKYIYWAAPNGSSTYNDIIFVLDPDKRYNTSAGRMRSWVIFEGINASQFWISTISGRSKVYFGDATTGGFVFEMGVSTYTDNGTAVTMTVRTRDYMLDPARNSKWKYMHQKYQTGSSGDVEVKARVDQAADFTLQDTIDLSGTSPGLGPTGSFTLGDSTLGGANIAKKPVTFKHLTGTLLGIELSEDSANACELYDYQIFGYTKGLRNS